MKISPVSFGKAVRINGSTSEAFDVARLVNDKKVSKSEKKAQEQAKIIFDDATNNNPAIVVTYQTHLGNNVEDVFILSGAEAHKAKNLYEKMVDKMIIAGELYGSGDKFQLSCKEIQDEHNEELGKLLQTKKPNYEISIIYNAKGTAVKQVEKHAPIRRRLLEIY